MLGYGMYEELQKPEAIYILYSSLKLHLTWPHKFWAVGYTFVS